MFGKIAEYSCFFQRLHSQIEKCCYVLGLVDSELEGEQVTVCAVSDLILREGRSG